MTVTVLHAFLRSTDWSKVYNISSILLTTETFLHHLDHAFDSVSGVSASRLEWDVCPSLSSDVCKCWNKTMLWKTHVWWQRGCQGLCCFHAAQARWTNPNWSMETLYRQTAGFHEIQSCIESPAVISCYSLQFELDCAGRHKLCFCVCFCCPAVCA